MSAGAESGFERAQPQQLADLLAEGLRDDHAAPGSRAAPLHGLLDIPGYTIVQEIHRGGQGVVYAAIQESTKRKVALKVLREGPFATAAERARFDREVEILAQLNHPNIVAIHDRGTHAGYFFLVMDYIAGRTLDAWCAAGPRSIDEVLRLFATICDAVNAAHLRGIIHRDLKPGNIRVDDQNTPYVLDFGLAKLSGAEPGPAAAMTMTGQFLGSLPWASPEQAEAVPGRIDLRTDVYALGIVLFQMLTGRFPYDVVGSMHTVLDRIIKAPPARPSTLRPDSDDELDTVVLKCLQKEPERRYQSAGELARDIRHYLANEPLEAKRDSTTYLLRKQLARHRVPLAIGAAFVVVILAGFITASAYWYRANVHAAKLAAGDYRLRIALAQVAGDAGQIGLAEDYLAHCPEPMRGWEWRHLQRRLDQSTATFTGHAHWVRGLACSADGATVVSCDAEGHVVFRSLLKPEEALIVQSGLHWIHDLATDRSLRRMVLVGDGGFVEEWSVPRRVPLGALARCGDSVAAVAVSADGRHVAWTGPTGEIGLWSETDGAGTIQVLAAHADDERALCFSPTSDRLASGGLDSTLRIWDVATGAPLGPPRPHDTIVSAIAFDPGGERIVTGTLSGRLYAWDLTRDDAAAESRAAHIAPVRAIAFDPHGAWLATGGTDRLIILWDARTLRELKRFRGHRGPVNALAVVEVDGRQRLVSASDDKTVRTWDPAGPAEPRLILPPTVVASEPNRRAIVSVVVDPTDQWLLTLANDGVVQAMSLAEPTISRLVGTFPKAGGGVVVIDADGRRVAAGTSQDGYRVWNWADDTAIPAIVGPDGCIRALAFRPGSDELAVLTCAGVVTLLAEDGTPVRGLASPPSLASDLAFSPDGNRLAVAYDDRAVRLYDAASLVLARTLTAGQATMACVEFSPTGERLAAGNLHGRVYVWDLATGRLLRDYDRHEGQDVLAVCWHPDGRRLASGAWDSAIRVWDPDADTDEEVLALRGHVEGVRALTFSPDGTTLYSAGGDGTIRAWSAARK